jgi:LysM repeat protein
MKKILLAFVLLLGSFVGFSQTGLQIGSTENRLYVTHTVSAKENYYSVGRLYNISPKDIVAFNGLDMNKGLEVGQTVKIPLEAANFSQTENKGTPVYYVVGDKEGLYRVSLKNNKVLLANLRKWNSLKNDNVSTGTKLIVGYLVPPEMQNGGGATVAKANNSPAPTPDAATDNAAVAARPKQEKQAEPKKEEEKPAVKNTTPPPATHTVSSTTTITNAADAGYFRTQYDQQVKTASANKDATVTSGIFKTASGWQDGKYYALMDGVEPGTIVRIINPTNNKAIYAKVLGQMSGIRQNQGLELRISNAGATALSIPDTDKFIVRITY